MHRVSISSYVGPITLFDLQGCTDSNEPGGEPCRIKVGPRRFLEITVSPAHFRADIWTIKDGQALYLVGENIPERRDKSGKRLFDAVEFLQERIGKSYPCSADNFKRGKWHTLWSDTFLTTEYGAAKSRESWLDISVYHSNLYFAPGALTICGQEVQSIYCSSFSECTRASKEVLRPLMEKLLSAPHQLGINDIRNRLPGLYKADALSFNDLFVETDSGTYNMEYSWQGSRLQASLSDGGSVFCRTVCTELPEVLEQMLYLMQAPTKEKLDTQLSKMLMLGLVTSEGKE